MSSKKELRLAAKAVKRARPEEDTEPSASEHTATSKKRLIEHSSAIESEISIVEPLLSSTAKVPYINKQRVLLIASRGITARYRHFLEDLKKVIPHHKKDNKLDAKGKHPIYLIIFLDFRVSS